MLFLLTLILSAAPVECIFGWGEKSFFDDYNQCLTLAKAENKSDVKALAEKYGDCIGQADIIKKIEKLTTNNKEFDALIKEKLAWEYMECTIGNISIPLVSVDEEKMTKELIVGLESFSACMDSKPIFKRLALEAATKS